MDLFRLTSVPFVVADLNSLPGKIGQQDVADVVRATRLALEQNEDGVGAGGYKRGGDGSVVYLDAGAVAVVGRGVRLPQGRALRRWRP